MGNTPSQRLPGLQAPTYSQFAPVPLNPAQSLPVGTGTAGQGLTNTLMGFVPQKYAGDVSTIGNALQNLGGNLQSNPNGPLAGVLQGNPNSTLAGFLQAAPGGAVVIKTTDGKSITLQPDQQGRVFISNTGIVNTQDAAYLYINQGKIAITGNDPSSGFFTLKAYQNGRVPISYDEQGQIWVPIEQQ